MRGETARELDEIRSAGAGAMDRELRMLREARTQAESECRRLREELSAEKTGNEEASLAALRRQVRVCV